MSTRTERRRMAEDTIAQLEDDAETWTAFKKTTVWTPRTLRPPITQPESETVIDVWPGLTTIEACRRLSMDHHGKVCALNFASARNPGGGCLGGSGAQEERICDVSGLYHCLNGGSAAEMYRQNNANRRRGLYNDLAVYSPLVPVIKSEDGAAVNRYHVNFVSCPSVNAGNARSKGVSERDIARTMMGRIDLALNVMTHHGHRVVVLGAYGCGVFENKEEDIARMFQTHLSTKYEGVFDRVVFAIPSHRVADTFVYALK